MNKIEGTIKITVDQLKEILTDHLKTIIQVPHDHFLTVRLSSLSQYSDSTVDFTVRHEDERVAESYPVVTAR